MSAVERRRELKRRRQRRKKLNHWKSRVPKASASEKARIAQKVRAMTSGADAILVNLGLTEA